MGKKPTTLGKKLSAKLMEHERRLAALEAGKHKKAKRPPEPDDDLEEDDGDDGDDDADDAEEEGEGDGFGIEW